MPGVGVKNAHSERARIARSRGELVLVQGAGTDVPTAPDHLGAAGIAIWTAAWETPWTCDSDAAAIEALAVLEDELVRFQVQVDTDGLTHERILQSARGDILGASLEAHPLLVEIRRGRTLANNLRRELGMTPTSRARLGVTVLEGEEKKSALEELVELRSRKLGAA